MSALVFIVFALPGSILNMHFAQLENNTPSVSKEERRFLNKPLIQSECAKTNMTFHGHKHNRISPIWHISGIRV